jgi:GDPmannose 4,6-dehydratase
MVVIGQVEFECLDICDMGNIIRSLRKINPDEIYNLAAQSFVGTSFEQPIFTTDINALGVTRVLDAIQLLQLNTKFYQASTSEMFGLVQEIPQSEKTPFYPRSPYAVAKLAGYWMTVNYRESYGIFATNGILFNHESPLRGVEFVTRKITLGLSKVKCGQLERLVLGNLDSKRDWGFAPDYVLGMWKILQQETPSDYVLATGRTETVRFFVEGVAQRLGYDLQWQRQDSGEFGIDQKTGAIIVEASAALYRPSEVDLLVGDATKAKVELAWSAQTQLESLMDTMTSADLRRVQSGHTYF